MRRRTHSVARGHRLIGGGQPGKPASDVFLEAARRLELPPKHCAAIEDSGNRIRAAHAAGMHVVAVPSPRYPPGTDTIALADVLLSAISELCVESLQIAEGPQKGPLPKVARAGESSTRGRTVLALARDVREDKLSVQVRVGVGQSRAGRHEDLEVLVVLVEDDRRIRTAVAPLIVAQSEPPSLPPPGSCHWSVWLLTK